MDRPISPRDIRDVVATIKFSNQAGTHDNDGVFTNKEPISAEQALDALLHLLKLDPVRTKELYIYKPDGVPDEETSDLTAHIESKVSGKKYRIYEKKMYELQLDDAVVSVPTIGEAKAHLGHYESWRGMTHYNPAGTSW